MRKLYMAGAIIVFLFILVLSLPQVAATCSWYTPLGGGTNPSLVLFQSTGLGAILGGLSVLYWKSTKEAEQDESEENSDSSKPAA